MFPSNVYDVLKYVAQIGLPAVGVFYAAMAQVWNLPFAEQIPATINALVLLLGALLSISSTQFYKARAADAESENEKTAVG